MNIETIKTFAQSTIVIAGAVIGCIGTVSAVLAHLPFPAKWAERFARAALWASNAKFSVNQRTP